MSQAIRIAVIDSVPKVHWNDDEGFTDGEKFVDLLAAQNPDAHFNIYYASEYQLPKSVDDYDGFMLSGSPVSANDGFDWIGNLSELILAANEKNKRIVASCFGHQLVAKTFGGTVGKNEKGWVIGNYPLQVSGAYDWMTPAATTTGLFHFNKERVTQLPSGAVSFARSDDYPDYAYTLGDNIFCVQGHPEQPKRAMNNFMKVMKAELPEDVYDKACAMIDNGTPDSEVWGRWMMNFFLA